MYLSNASQVFGLALYRTCLCGLILLASTLCSVVYAESELYLRAGDRIKIQLPGEAKFQLNYTLDAEGRVLLPEAGVIELQGLTLGQAKTRLKNRLGHAYRNLERLQLWLQERQLLVRVLGYVENPGQVSLAPKASIQMALEAAGGLVQGAQLNKLQLTRDGKKIPFDYKAYLDSGRADILPALEPMDEIFVPASPLTGNVEVSFDAQTLAARGDAANKSQSVTVFGEVHRPGSFALKADQSVIDLLMRAGGVTRYAGIEQIRVISQSQPMPFNMREYLDTGKAELMPKLNPGDTIFVPQSSDQIKTGSRTVFVMGEVKTPGAYETKEGASFIDVLANAGGPTRFAESRQIRLIKGDGKVVFVDLQAYTDGRIKTLPPIGPGDAILVPEKTDMNEKSWLKVAPNRAIRVIGAVLRPGRYEWSAEMSILDILAHAGGANARADTSRLKILQPTADGQLHSELFNLEDILQNGGALKDLPHIHADSTIVVPELPIDPNDNRSMWVRQASDSSIYIMGQVGAPGRYAFKAELNFLDILAAAQGPTASADLHNVSISHRAQGSNQQTGISHFNLAQYFATGDESLLPQVLPEDVIYFPDSKRNWVDKNRRNSVQILGAVAKPGRYTFSAEMNLLDLLAEAGGPKDNALHRRIKIVNLNQNEKQAREFDLLAFASEGDLSKIPQLRAGDTIYIPSKEQGRWNSFAKIVRDSLSVTTLVHLLIGI